MNDAKLRQQLQANLALHMRALEDLRAARARAEEAQKAQKAQKILALKHEMESDQRLTLTDVDGSSRSPLAGIVFIDCEDHAEESLNQERRRLADEVTRITGKIKDIREALAGLDKQS
jgi:DNA gyrase/topoisomerase IV subunit B